MKISPRLLVVIGLVAVGHLGLLGYLMRTPPDAPDAPDASDTAGAAPSGLPSGTAVVAPSGEQSAVSERPVPAPAFKRPPVVSPDPVVSVPAAAVPAPSAGVSAVPAASSGASLMPNASVSYGSFLEDPGDLPLDLETLISQQCRSGILVDLGSRRILWQKDAQTSYAIASMSKIMTAYELICELSEPGCPQTLETVVRVPKKLFRKYSDCHIYMDPRESFTIDELLKCMMIHSANDCAFLIGETMAGSEEAFVGRMNRRAAAMGLKSFSFCNTNGLPDRKNRRANRGSAMDMAVLAERVMDIPVIMKWAGTAKDAIREKIPNRRFDLNNKNRLLGKRGSCTVTGLKTGYIDESKFCITVTAENQGRRMVCVVMGVDKAKTRDTLVRKLLDWGFSLN